MAGSPAQQGAVLTCCGHPTRLPRKEHGLKPVRRAAESCALAGLNFLAGLTGLSFACNIWERLTPLADAERRPPARAGRLLKGLTRLTSERDGGIPTSGEMADDVRETLSAGFRMKKHKAQWQSTLETYAAPLRAKPWTPSPR